ncbi:hypothetical protein [Stenotrophomonas sp. 9(2022)]|uniref:hypothetical protein n=1 Tax=Stenotrophomonas sp. 9(2022) TaxID=2950153 RepID=UPI002113C186|nr:hypothetical protein [Stenotrophomonas sp. 9(2022)]
MTAPSMRPTKIITATGKERTEGHQRGNLKSRAVSLARTPGNLREARDPEQGYSNMALGHTPAYHFYKELHLFAGMMRSAEAAAQVYEPSAEWLKRIQPVVDAIKALKDTRLPQSVLSKWPKSLSSVRTNGLKRAPAILREFGFTEKGA